jgi:hypothetical protein
MSEKNFVLGFALVGILLQLIIVFFIIDPNTIFWPDSQKNYTIATQLANDVPYSTTQNLANLGRAPGYPFLLSYVIKVFGSDVVTLRLFHVILFPFFIFAIYLIGKNLSGTDGMVALIAAGLSAVYPYYLYVPLTFYPESILIYLFAAIALSMVYTKKWGNSIAGVALTALLIASAVMIRPTAVVWLPVAIFYLSCNQDAGLFRHLRTAAIIILIPVVFVTMWMARNHEIHGVYMFTTKPTELLLNTYTENSRWDVKHPPMPARIVKKLKETKDLKEKQKFAIKEATNFIVKNPWRAFSIAGMQMLDLWNPIPRTITKNEYGSAKYKIIPALMYAVILLLAIPAFIKHRKNRFVQALFLLMLFNTVLNGLFMVSVRYRIITDFGLILMSSFTIVSILDKFSLRERINAFVHALKR